MKHKGKKNICDIFSAGDALQYEQRIFRGYSGRQQNCNL